MQSARAGCAGISAVIEATVGWVERVGGVGNVVRKSSLRASRDSNESELDGSRYVPPRLSRQVGLVPSQSAHIKPI